MKLDPLRPGGLEITETALELCAFPRGAKIADIGCGSGVTVSFLTKSGFEAFGIEADPERLAEARERTEGCFMAADASDMPFEDAELDGVFFECSFSKMKDPGTVLSEAKRVLKIGGKIAVSDFYSAGEETILSGELGRVENKDSIERRLDAAGFENLSFTDFTKAATELWGRMIFDMGPEEAAIYAFGLPFREKLTAYRYGLFIAEKRG